MATVSINIRPDGSYSVRIETKRVGLSHVDARRYHAIVDRALDQAARDYEAGLSACPTLREAVQAYLVAPDGGMHLSAARKGFYRRIIDRFARDLAPPGQPDIQLDRVPVHALRQWIATRLAEPGNQGKYNPSPTVAPATVKKEISALKTLARWCANQRWCSLDLDIFRVHVKVPRLHKTSNRFPPAGKSPLDLVSALRRIEQVAPDIHRVLVCVLLMGVRPMAALAIKRGDYSPPTNLHRGRVRLIGLKGGLATERTFQYADLPHDFLESAMCASAETLTKAGRRVDADAPLFPAPRGGFWHLSSFDARLARVCKQLRLGRITPYTLRHSAITWLCQQGVAAQAIRHYAKHLHLSTQDIYDLTSGELARDAYTVIEGILDNPSLVHDEESEAMSLFDRLFRASDPPPAEAPARPGIRSRDEYGTGADSASP